MIVNHSPRRSSPRRNYDFPPVDSANFAGIKDPSLLHFANSLRKKDRSLNRTVDGGPPPHLSNTHEQVWNHLLNSAKTHGYTGMALLPNTKTPVVSPMKRSKKKKAPQQHHRIVCLVSLQNVDVGVSKENQAREKEKEKEESHSICVSNLPDPPKPTRYHSIPLSRLRTIQHWPKCVCVGQRPV